GLVGYLTGPEAKIFGLNVVSFFDFLGTFFVNALKMLVVPLITASVISGVASLGAPGDIGRLGGKTLLFYVTTTLLAVLVALVVSNVVQPGIVDGAPAKELLALESQSTEVSEKVQHGAG